MPDTSIGSVRSWPPGRAVPVGSLVVALVAYLDHYTGYELSFSIFYLVPISLVTWYSGRQPGHAICLASALAWLFVDITSGHVYSLPWIPFWNASVRLAFFLVTSYLLSELRIRLIREELLARTDGLTQALNARAFVEVGEKWLQLARRKGHATTLAYLDIDNFKSVNDLRGHSEGDRLLGRVAEVIRTSIRSADSLGRLGGDEFAVLMPETGLADAAVSFERIHQALRSQASAENWDISVSIGVAVFASAPPCLEDALKMADQLMYRVKSGGKNRVLCQEL